MMAYRGTKRRNGTDGTDGTDGMDGMNDVDDEPTTQGPPQVRRVESGRMMVPTAATDSPEIKSAPQYNELSRLVNSSFAINANVKHTFMYGRPGSGKSFALDAVCAQKGIKCIHVPSGVLQTLLADSEFRQILRTKGMNIRHVLHLIMEAPSLVLHWDEPNQQSHLLLCNTEFSDSAKPFGAAVAAVMPSSKELTNHDKIIYYGKFKFNVHAETIAPMKKVMESGKVMFVMDHVELVLLSLSVGGSYSSIKTQELSEYRSLVNRLMEQEDTICVSLMTTGSISMRESDAKQLSEYFNPCFTITAPTVNPFDVLTQKKLVPPQRTIVSDYNGPDFEVKVNGIMAGATPAEVISVFQAAMSKFQECKYDVYNAFLDIMQQLYTPPTGTVKAVDMSKREMAKNTALESDETFRQIIMAIRVGSGINVPLPGSDPESGDAMLDFVHHTNQDKGALLFGPPGTGKTFTAEYIAWYLAKHQYEGRKFTYWNVAAADIKSKWFGESESKIAELFQQARNNGPSLIFFDEFETLAKSRSSGADGGASSDANNAIVTTLLREIDGVKGVVKRDESDLHNPFVFVLAATNHPENIDPALVRPGRLGINMEVSGLFTSGEVVASILKKVTSNYEDDEKTKFAFFTPLVSVSKSYGASSASSSHDTTTSTVRYELEKAELSTGSNKTDWVNAANRLLTECSDLFTYKQANSASTKTTMKPAELAAVFGKLVQYSVMFWLPFNLCGRISHKKVIPLDPLVILTSVCSVVAAMNSNAVNSSYQKSARAIKECVEWFLKLIKTMATRTDGVTDFCVFEILVCTMITGRSHLSTLLSMFRKDYDIVLALDSKMKDNLLCGLTVLEKAAIAVAKDLTMTSMVISALFNMAHAKFDTSDEWTTSLDKYLNHFASQLLIMRITCYPYFAERQESDVMNSMYSPEALVFVQETQNVLNYVQLLVSESSITTPNATNRGYKTFSDFMKQPSSTTHDTVKSLLEEYYETLQLYIWYCLKIGQIEYTGTEPLNSVKPGATARTLVYIPLDALPKTNESNSYVIELNGTINISLVGTLSINELIENTFKIDETSPATTSQSLMDDNKAKRRELVHNLNYLQAVVKKLNSLELPNEATPPSSSNAMTDDL